MILHPDPPRARARACGRAAALLFASFGLALGGCTTLSSAPPASQECLLAETWASFEVRSRRAKRSRGERLEREIQRLRVDLHQAEIAMLATDSEVRPGRNRASAVSMLAEARIALEQAERSVSWNLGAVQEGQQKLAEAERQLKAGRLPAAGSAGSTGSDAVPSDTLHTPRVRGPRDPLIRRLAPTGHR